MFFTPVVRRAAYYPSMRNAQRILEAAVNASTAHEASEQCAVEQNEKAFTLSFDVPGVSREQLVIGIEGNVVRLETKPEAARKYKAAYELPQDIDATASEAKLELGVLTLKLSKKLPESRMTELTIN